MSAPPPHTHMSALHASVLGLELIAPSPLYQMLNQGIDPALSFCLSSNDSSRLVRTSNCLLPVLATACTCAAAVGLLLGVTAPADGPLHWPPLLMAAALLRRGMAALLPLTG